MYSWELIFSFICLPQSQNNHVKKVYSFTKTVGNPVSCMNTGCEVQSEARADMSMA
jgi:hypothetical protein